MAELYVIMEVIEHSAQISNNLTTIHTDSRSAIAVINNNVVAERSIPRLDSKSYARRNRGLV